MCAWWSWWGWEAKKWLQPGNFIYLMMISKFCEKAFVYILSLKVWLKMNRWACWFRFSKLKWWFQDKVVKNSLLLFDLPFFSIQEQWPQKRLSSWSETRIFAKQSRSWALTIRPLTLKHFILWYCIGVQNWLFIVAKRCYAG